MSPEQDRDAALTLLNYSAIEHLLSWLDSSGADLRSGAGFLAGYRQAITDYRASAPDLADSWFKSARLAALQAYRQPRALLALLDSWPEPVLTGLMLAGLPRLDPRFGELFANLGGDGRERSITIELIARIVAGQRGSDLTARGYRPLLEAGLLTPAGVGVTLPPLVWEALRDDALTSLPRGGYQRDASQLVRPGDLDFAPDFIERLEGLGRLLSREFGRPAMPQSYVDRRGAVPDGAALVVLRHDPGVDLAELAGALAKSCSRGLIHIRDPGLDDGGRLRPLNVPGLGAAANLLGALLLYERSLDPGDSLPAPDLPGLAGPMLLALGREGGLETAEERRKITLDVPLPSPQQRRRIWRAALPDLADEDIRWLGERFRIAAGHIRAIAGGALGEAALNGRTAPSQADILTAARHLGRQQLDVLAEPLDAFGDWPLLVTRDQTTSQLIELADRCRNRESLADAIGAPLSATLGRGVRALFTGPSGTGKTMAARILASELGYDLYRVDLGAVVNKYVGETEKNLHQVLARAEALDVILLLDEGDALLGSRTDVKSANDRYANLETNYLLQRLETYQGIVLITTNLGDNIDKAFQRRMDVVVPFFRPRATERTTLWQEHLPREHSLTAPFLDDVVARCALTGGQIRNAVAHAAACALEERRRVDDNCLAAAILREYQKAGASNPMQAPATAAGDDPFDGFVSALGNVPRGDSW